MSLFMSHLLVVCPLKVELKYLIQALQRRGWEFKTGTIGKLMTYHEVTKQVIFSIGGHGKTQFALQSQHLISEVKSVSGLICLGAGGALTDELKVGDLVLAEKTVEHDYTEKFDKKARLPEFLAHSELLQRVQINVKNTKFKLHTGIVASGDEDIIESERARLIRARTGALAVAWEGSGGARACAYQAIPFLEIRSITDHCTGSVAESFKENLRMCMNHSAELIGQLLENGFHPLNK